MQCATDRIRSIDHSNGIDNETGHAIKNIIDSNITNYITTNTASNTDSDIENYIWS